MQHRARHLLFFALLASSLPAGAAAQQSAAPVPDSGGSKRNVLPAIEIAGFLIGLNIADRILLPNEMQDGKKVYSSTFATTWDHLRQQHWVTDIDPFTVNQFAHPYQGATMYGLARSSGHGFWTSAIQANIGSFIWKMAGETDPPSIDDLITTGQAGSLLGEALYRIADLVLKNGPAQPHRWQEYAAYVISPPSGLNRRVFGDRFKAQLPDTPPSTIWQVKFGATLDALAHTVTSPGTVLRSDATAEFSMSYGLPGLTGYECTRPLDYFDFQFSVLTNAKNPIENVMLRGLLVGGKTPDGENSHGIWGLYGSYDYISPSLFRVSSTALSVGTTRQYSFPRGLALQSTVLIALRFLSGDRAMFEVSAREYYVTGIGSDDSRGSEAIFRGNAGVTLRLSGGHSIGAHIASSARSARYGTLPNRKTSEQALTVSYSILGGSGFAAAK